jgi:hypothetical protein
MNVGLTYSVYDTIPRFTIGQLESATLNITFSALMSGNVVIRIYWLGYYHNDVAIYLSLNGHVDPMNVELAISLDTPAY